MSVQVSGVGPGPGWLLRANTTYHEIGLKVFAAIVLAHWVEHLFQAVQIWVLGWPRAEAGGALGLSQPWLVTSEWLHYAFALLMIASFFLLLRGFAGASRNWWVAALVVQFWHHVEHAFLVLQAQSGYFFLARPIPTSFLQVWVPRAELHLVYNGLVTVPMLVAVYLHMRPPREVERAPACSCGRT